MSPAAQLHDDALVIDSHNDSIVYHIRAGNRSLVGREPGWAGDRGGLVSYLRGPHEGSVHPLQLNLEKMIVGGVDAAFFAVDVTRPWRNHLPYFLDALGFFLTDLSDQDRLVVARTASELERARAEGRRAALLVIENSDALEGSLHILRTFYDLGVRSITLTHNPLSLAAAGNGEAESGGGLTQFGVALVREMNRLGMLVDVSHIAPAGFRDVLAVSERPVIASHSCCAALCPHPRNLTDEQLEQLASAGGVVSITFVPSFLSPGHRDSDPGPSLDLLLDHVAHAVRIAGEDHVGFGSDFDGGGTAVVDATHYPAITAGLLARGHSERAIRKLLGENLLRVLRETCG